MSLKTDCFAYWKMDSPTWVIAGWGQDATGNGFHCWASGIGQELGVGPGGSAMAVFDGIAQKCIVPDTSAFIGRHKASLNYWVKIDDYPTATLKSGISYFSSNGNWNHYPFNGDNKVYESFGCVTRKTVGLLAHTYTNCNMITITVDEALNEFKYYVNGELVYQTTAGVWDWVSGQRLGSDGDVSGNFLKGRLSQVGLWKRALTNTEIGGLYNSGNGDFYPFASNVPDTLKTKKSNKKSMFNFNEDQIREIVRQQYGRDIMLMTPHSFTKACSVATTVEDVKFAYFGKVIATPLGSTGSFGLSLQKTGGLNNGVAFYGDIPAYPTVDSTGVLDLENQLFNKYVVGIAPSGCNISFIGFKIQFS